MTIHDPYPWPSLCSDLNADILRYVQETAVYQVAEPGKAHPIPWKKKLSALISPSMLCVVLYRLSHWFYVKRLTVIACIIAYFNFLINKASIHPACQIGSGLYIPHTASIVIQAHAGSHLTVYSAGTIVAKPLLFLFSAKLKNCPQLGDRVIVGSRANVVGCISIGDCATISFNADVSSDVSANTTVLRKKLVNYTLVDLQA